MKIIGFAGSNSSDSINARLAQHFLMRLEKKSFSTSYLSLLEYNDVPLYSSDREKADGIPSKIIELAEVLQSADALVISVAEHNGNVTAFFKNLLDWLSRHDKKFLKGAPILITSTSPGQRGASNSMAIASKMLQYFDGNVVSSLAFGSFHNFYREGNIIDSFREKQIEELIEEFSKEIQ